MADFKGPGQWRSRAVAVQEKVEHPPAESDLLEEPVQAGRRGPGQRYRHGWVPVGPDLGLGEHEHERPAIVQQRMHDLITRARKGGHFEQDAAWYSVQHDQIGRRAKAAGIEPAVFAGMVAATSPQCIWQTSTGRLLNIDLAEMAAVHARAHPGMSGKEVASVADPPGMLKNSLANAVDIYNGKPIDEALKGPKTRSFYDNLTQPNGGDAVTIDTHMARAMADDHKLDQVGVKQFATGLTYGWAADQVRVVGKNNGITGAQAQAVIWSQWKREGA